MIKVLHINCTDAGSTGKIINEISKELKKENSVSVLCTPKITSAEADYIKKIKTAGKYEQAIYKRVTAITGYRYACSPLSTHRIIASIKKNKPDVIHFHSANCYMANLYTIMKYISKKDIPVVITNHAEFYYTGNCAHAYGCDQWIAGCKKCPDKWNSAHSLLFDRTNSAWKKMKECISSLSRVMVVSVSPWVENRSAMSGIMSDIPQQTIYNGVDEKTFRLLINQIALKEKYHFSGKIILFVTAMFSDNEADVKGGKYIIKLAEMIGTDAMVVVVGKTNISSPLPSNIIVIGEVKVQQVLAEYYNLSDIVVTAGKKETFGMTVAESLCCGTPVVGFEAGGPESIAINEYSDFVPYGDVESLYRVTLKWLKISKLDIAPLIEKEAHKRYSSTVMAQKYIEVYKHLMDISS